MCALYMCVLCGCTCVCAVSVCYVYAVSLCMCVNLCSIHVCICVLCVSCELFFVCVHVCVCVQLRAFVLSSLSSAQLDSEETGYFVSRKLKFK